MYISSITYPNHVGGINLNYLQIPGDQTTSTLLYIISFVVLMLISFVWSQRIQASMILNDVNKQLTKLQGLKENSRKELFDYMTTTCKATQEGQKRIDQILEYFTIMPVDLDPKGVVAKIEHIIRVQDDRIREELKKISPQADAVQLSVSQNILEVATSLNAIFKLVRHLFLLGKKTKGLFLVVQLQMIMPTLMQQAEAFYSAIDSFKNAQPIGDGLGPMVAGKLMLGKEKVTIEKETIYAKTEYKNRTLYVLRAEGPMGVGGRPHIGVEKLLQDPETGIKTLIMIDAALKLEGEKTGDIAEGIGAAIGGIGFEKFRIESIASDKEIPMYAIVVKQSFIDVISVMTKDIADSVEKVIAMVQRVIEEKTKEGEAVLIVGVGNSLGIV